MNLTLLPDTDPILRKVADSITEFNADLQELCQQMVHFMIENRGIGLAAPQVGISKRIIVTDIDDSILQVRYVINPEIVLVEGEQNRKEGCLTFPGLFLDVKRSRKVIVKFQDVQGNINTFITSGLNAVILQHEIDHLDGKLFIDRVSPIALALARKKLQR